MDILSSGILVELPDGTKVTADGNHKSVTNRNNIAEYKKIYGNTKRDDFDERWVEFNDEKTHPTCWDKDGNYAPGKNPHDMWVIEWEKFQKLDVDVVRQLLSGESVIIIIFFF